MLSFILLICGCKVESRIHFYRMIIYAFDVARFEGITRLFTPNIMLQLELGIEMYAIIVLVLGYSQMTCFYVFVDSPISMPFPSYLRCYHLGLSGMRAIERCYHSHQLLSREEEVRLQWEMIRPRLMIINLICEAPTQ